MSRCECCRCEIREPVINTVAGVFFPGWGMCRGCWRLVARSMRRAVVRARVAFRAAPHLEQSVELYWLWQLAVGEAQLVSYWRAAA